MQKIATLIIKFRWWLFAVFLLAAIVCGFLSQYVSINYDFKKYLPEDSSTKLALNIFKEEGFEDQSQVFVMLQNQSVARTEQIADKLRKGLGVVTHNDNLATSILITTRYAVDPSDNAEYSLLRIIIGEEEAATTRAAVDILPALLKGEDYVLSGGAIQSDVLGKSIVTEIPLILGICIFIVLIVLFLTSKAYLDPLMFLAVIVVSVVINMGTNVIFSEISYITQSVAAILQLALAIDYSIIFLNFFEKAHSDGKDAVEAAKEALTESFSAILSSSLTTIAGLVALMFMTFTIGFDIGMVLMKGIVISMLTVFLFMPSLLIGFKRKKEKTHKTLPMPTKPIFKCSWSARKILPLVMVAVVAVAAVLNFTQIDYGFKVDMGDNYAGQKVADVFGNDNLVIVIMQNSLEEEQSLALQHEIVSYVQSYKFADEGNLNASKLKTVYAYDYQYSEQDLADMSGVDPVAINCVFALMEKTGETLSIKQAVDFAEQNLAENLLETYITPKQLALLTGQPPEVTGALYWVLGYKVEKVKIGVLIDDLQLPENRQKLVSYAVSRNMDLTEAFEMADAIYAQKAQIAAIDVNKTLASVSGLFCGEKYNIVMFSIDMEQASNAVFDFIDDLNKYLDNGNFASLDTYVAGESSVLYEIASNFNSDQTKTGLITIVAILLIVGLVFKSLSLPCILILVIQGAIWIAMSFSALSATPVFFMSYIMVSCILMGATIDYGILMSESYIKKRKVFCKKRAMEEAIKIALPTVITSGVIMIVCGIVVSLISSIEAIYTVGELLWRGTLVSVLMVLFVLPSILVIMDKLLFKTTHTGFVPTKEDANSDKNDANNGDTDANKTIEPKSTN